MKSHIPQIQMNLRDVFVLFGCFDFSPKDITLFVFGVFSLSKFGTRIGAAAFLLPADTSERDNRSDF